MRLQHPFPRVWRWQIIYGRPTLALSVARRNDPDREAYNLSILMGAADENAQYQQSNKGAANPYYQYIYRQRQWGVTVRENSLNWDEAVAIVLLPLDPQNNEGDEWWQRSITSFCTRPPPILRLSILLLHPPHIFKNSSQTTTFCGGKDKRLSGQKVVLWTSVSGRSHLWVGGPPWWRCRWLRVS